MTARNTDPKAACCDSRPAKLGRHESDEELARLAWALAHPMRVRIVRLLVSRTSCTCGEVVDELPLAQSTVSQHLKILKEAELIQGEVEGPKVCYCINPAKLKTLKALIAGM